MSKTNKSPAPSQSARPKAVASLIEQRAGSGARDTKSNSDFRGIIILRFRDGGHIVMKVLELERAKLILWQVVGGSTESVGTKVSLGLAPEDGFTAVSFGHQGWKEPSDFMHHCSTKMGDLSDESERAPRTRQGRSLSGRPAPGP